LWIQLWLMLELSWDKSKESGTSWLAPED